MEYQRKQKAARIRRSKAMKRLADKGMPLSQIGALQNPPISKQRVFKLLWKLANGI